MEEEVRLPRLYEGVLKVMSSTYCELDEWDKVHMLEESEEYAYHYSSIQ